MHTPVRRVESTSCFDRFQGRVAMARTRCRFGLAQRPCVLSEETIGTGQIPPTHNDNAPLIAVYGGRHRPRLPDSLEDGGDDAALLIGWGHGH